MKASIVGAGRQGRRRAAALDRDGGDALLAVADIDLAAARCLADRYGARATALWQEAVEHPGVEAVIICTPPYAHEEIARAALRLGRHVLCEKPLALTAAAAAAMVEAAREAGAVLACGFNHRHHPGLRQARAWLEAGRLGEVTHALCRYGIGGRPSYERDWRVRPEYSGGGQLMDQAMHALDLFRWFLGDFQSAFGVLSTAYWPIAPVEDNVFALLSTADGRVGSLHASWTRWRNLFSFELFGRDGYVAVEGLGGSYGGEQARLGRRSLLQPFHEEVVEFRGPDASWAAEWREFAAAVREGREPLGAGRDGLQALRLAEAVYRSARSGCREPVAP